MSEELPPPIPPPPGQPWSAPPPFAPPAPPPAYAPPPPPPYPPSGAWVPLPEPAPVGRGRRPLIVAAAAALVVVLVAVGGVVFVTARHHGPTFPQQWDGRVADLVKFDEKTRGLTYKHPVEVEFMSEDDFKKAVTTSSSDLSADERKQIDAEQSGFRALGLIDGGVDLFAQMNDIQGGGTLAYYSPDTKKIRVKGTELTTATKVTLVHELVHVLQDQYFDLNQQENKLKTDGERSAFRSVVEGDAVGVEQAYVASLSAADRAEYEREDSQQGQASGYDKAPPILVANFTAPYTVGPPFVAALKAKGGNGGVDAAIKSPPPSEAALLDVFTYLDKTVPTAVDEPPLDPSEKRLDGGDFGATTWYLMLARRLDVHDAVKAVDGWGGDSYVTYSKANDEACVRARYRGKTSADSDEMEKLLQDWSDKGTGEPARVSRDGDVVQVSACDPGSDAKVPGTDRSPEALELLAIRLEVENQGFAEQASDQLVECTGNGVIHRLTLDDVASTDPAVKDTFSKAFEDAVSSCR